MIAGFVNLMRPKQWIKNVLIFTVPFASKVSDWDKISLIFLAFASFCLIASSVYVMNDICDYSSDVGHPIKSMRGIASGKVTRRASWILCLSILIAGFTSTYFYVPTILPYIYFYVFVNIAYSLGLKNIPFLEIVMVASGFLVRVLIGAAIVDVEPSSWILVCSLSGAMFVTISKRFAEKSNLQLQNDECGRKVLKAYTLEGLRTNLTIVASIFAGGYIQWASQINPGYEHRIWSLLSSLGVLIFLMNYVEALSKGRGEQPEQDLVHNVHLVGVFFLTVISVTLALYLN